MKMEHTITAAKDGAVAGVAVVAGSQVEDGQVLLRIDGPEALADAAAAAAA